MSCGVMPFRIRPPSRRLLKVLLFPVIRNGVPLWNVTIVETVQPPAIFSSTPSFSHRLAATEGQVVGAAHVDAHAAGR